MEEKNNVTEISFSDIIKMFRGKGRLIICIVLIFALLGSGITYFKAAFFSSYGNTVKFYITGVDNSEDILSLLRSESFAEKLLLDENGMPPAELCDSEAYNRALEAVNAYNLGREQVYNSRGIYEAFDYNITLPDGSITTMKSITDEYTRLQEAYDRALSLLTLYKSANADAVAEEPNHAKMTEKYEAMLEQSLTEKQSFSDNIYQKVLDEKSHLEQKLSAEFYNLKKLRNEASDAVEEILIPWRKSKGITQKVSDIHNSMSFEYESYTKKDGENTENIAIISVDVSVLRDRELAEFIIEKLHTTMPDYVEKTVEKYEKNLNSKCTLITPFSTVKCLENDGIVKNTVKNGALFAISAFALYGLIVILRGYIKRAMEE